MESTHRLAALFIAIAASTSAALFSPAAQAVQTISYSGNAAAGTILVHTEERRLYLVLGNGQALKYTVGVGKDGSQWSGISAIDGKFVRPNWAPPAAIRHEDPSLPDVIASGSPSNPMGAAAMTLAGGAYAIHGTNAPGSIGKFVSHGCIRMYNADVVDLFSRVSIGTKVVVTR